MTQTLRRRTYSPLVDWLLCSAIAVTVFAIGVMADVHCTQRGRLAAWVIAELLLLVLALFLVVWAMKWHRRVWLWLSVPLAVLTVLAIAFVAIYLPAGVVNCGVAL
jgi:uncharacterized membrane protein YoaK (UPF0700 family)